MARKAKKTRPTTATSNITHQLKKGTFATGQAWQKALKSYFGVKGRPLKHKLRSEKARKEFNELVHRYNVERPTISKEAERRKAIREKQKATVARNAPKKQAKKAVEQYEKMVDVLQTVHDEISTNIHYGVILGMMQEDPTLSAEDIAEAIKDIYNKLQSSLPSFTDGSPKELGERFSQALTSIMTDINTYDIAEIEKAITYKAKGEKSYRSYLAARNRKQERIANKRSKDRGAGSTRNKKKPGQNSRRKK